VQARCEIICIFGEEIAKRDFPLIPTPSTQSLKMCFPAAMHISTVKPYTRPQRLRAICNTFFLPSPKERKNEPRFSEGFVRKGGYSNGERISVLLCVCNTVSSTWSVALAIDCLFSQSSLK